MSVHLPFLAVVCNIIQIRLNHS